MYIYVSQDVIISGNVWNGVLSRMRNSRTTLECLLVIPGIFEFHNISHLGYISICIYIHTYIYINRHAKNLFLIADLDCTRVIMHLYIHTHKYICIHMCIYWCWSWFGLTTQMFCSGFAISVWRRLRRLSTVDSGNVDKNSIIRFKFWYQLGRSSDK